MRKGEELVIEGGRPIAKIVSDPVEASVEHRKLGLLKGEIWEAPNAWDPDPELERLFYEGDPNFRSALDDYLDELAVQPSKEDWKD